MLGRWLASGRTEAEFWRQTPASFAAAMQADAKARQSGIEEQIAVQWHAAQMQVMARAGKLDPLPDWLARVRPRPKRSVRDMILALQDAQARGAHITIRKVEG